MANRHELVATDILSAGGVRAGPRSEWKRKIAAIKRNRRVEVGPYVTFYFESCDTMWLQVQEMVYIEKGGAAQMPDELAAYNPLIPNGAELTATFMIEIDDPMRRKRVLDTLGGIEETAFIRVGGETIVRWPRPTRIAPRPRARRRPCSSCISRSRRRRSPRSPSPGAQVVLGLRSPQLWPHGGAARSGPGRACEGFRLAPSSAGSGGKAQHIPLRQPKEAPMSLREAGAITGVGETQYMRGTDRTPLSLQLEASLNAIADAGLKPTDIDGVIPYGHGAVAEDFITNFGIPDLRFSATTPMGGASAVAAIQCAVAAISAGICNHVLLSLGRTGYSGGRIGTRVQQMPQFRLIGEFEMPSGAIAPAQLYAAMARRHMELYGTTSRQFAEIAVTTRRHASLNPNATMRNPITIEDHQASRMISDPLRLLDCSLESDGGTAVVISAADRARDMKQRPVVVMGVAEGHPDSPQRHHAAAGPDHARPGQGGAEGVRHGRRHA